MELFFGRFAMPGPPADIEGHERLLPILCSNWKARMRVKKGGTQCWEEGLSLTREGLKG